MIRAHSNMSSVLIVSVKSQTTRRGVYEQVINSVRSNYVKLYKNAVELNCAQRCKQIK